MSNLKIIEELCGICGDLAKIVVEQQRLLAQHDTLALAEDIERAQARYTALIGREEWPDNLPEDEA